MIIGIPGTGSAGLISTIIAFQKGAIVGGVLGTIATVGWTLQGVGNAWYYRAVSADRPACKHRLTSVLDLATPP
jgi:secretory carrier-associated membrane protein